MGNETSTQRSILMSHIRGANTKPEIVIRSELFRMGFRFRKNDNKLPGKPDVVFPKYRAILFVNGCFWHGHPHCKTSHIPKTNTDFWLNKITTNQVRDKVNYEKLQQLGWRVGILWECSLRGKSATAKIPDKAGEIANWLQEQYDVPFTEF